MFSDFSGMHANRKNGWNLAILLDGLRFWWIYPIETIPLRELYFHAFSFSRLNFFTMSCKNKVWQFYLIQCLESHYTQVYFLFNVGGLTLLIREQHPGIHSCGIYLSFHIFVPWFSSIPGLGSSWEFWGSRIWEDRQVCKFSEKDITMQKII